MREMARGASEALLAASERVWLGGALSPDQLLAVSISKEGALYYARAQTKPEAGTPKAQ